MPGPSQVETQLKRQELVTHASGKRVDTRKKHICLVWQNVGSKGYQKKKKKVFPSKNKRVCSPRPKESSIALSLKNPKLLQHNKTENREDVGVG